MRRVALVLAAIVASASFARANGRFPETRSVAFRKGTPASITLGSTVGLLLSNDDGAHFYWVCDNAVFGDNNNSFDPDYKVSSDGTIYANTPAGLRVSRDGGCTYDIAAVETGLTTQKWVDAIDLGPSDELWITQAESGMTNDVFLSTDGGHQFDSKGLSSPIIWWKSVKLATSNPLRVYVSGYQVTQVADDGGPIAPTIHLKRTDDAGTSWTDLPITDFAFATSPLVLFMAVSPSDPDIVYAISQGADPPAGDKLYRSLNGGTNWTLVLDTTSSVRNVVFLADGTVMVATPMGGFAAGDGKTFTALAGSPQMACAAQRADGAIFACGANWDPDFSALGKSAPSPIGPWTKVFRFADMTGPLSCPAGTIQKDVCDLQLWPAVKEQFGITDPMQDGAPPDAPTTTMKKPGGCCDASGDGAETAVIVVLAVVIGGLLVRRGKRKRTCCS